MIRNEKGELVRAPVMDSFDYVDLQIMNTKGLLEYVDSVFTQNEKIPKLPNLKKALE